MIVAIRRVVMHPIDKERATKLAESLDCEVLLSQNWPADCVGLDGFLDGSAAANIAKQQLPGWKVRIL